MESAATKLSLELVMELLDQMPVGIAVSDHNDTVVWSNSTLAMFLGVPQGELANTPLSDLKSHRLRPISETSDTVLVPGNEKFPDRWLKQRLIPLGTDESSAYSATVYLDITEISNLLAEQEKLTEQLNQLSTVDRESGLLNHRAMLQHLEPLVSRSRRYNNELSVIAMELTNLDSIVDEYGPDAASFCVVEISRLLKDQMRWADIVSRVEYNRFVFVLPETDKDSALHLANKISSQIAELPINYENNAPFHMTTGFGVTGWEKGNDSVLLLRKASQALDAAKHAGANMIKTA